MFRDWILAKIINGERASYSAPKFARMQERTRSQMLEDLVANLQNHAETGQVSSDWCVDTTILVSDWSDPEAVPARLVAAYRAHAALLAAAGLGAGPVRGPGPDGEGLQQGLRQDPRRDEHTLRCHLCGWG